MKGEITCTKTTTTLDFSQRQLYKTEISY